MKTIFFFHSHSLIFNKFIKPRKKSGIKLHGILNHTLLTKTVCPLEKFLNKLRLTASLESICLFLRCIPSYLDRHAVFVEDCFVLNKRGL